MSEVRYWENRNIVVYERIYKKGRIIYTVCTYNYHDR